MVGVPGKSKGCSTCRRRKKGCDQKRPVCGQCTSSGYVCGGYQRDLTFISHPSTKNLERAVFLPVRPAPPQLAVAQSLERSLVVAQCRSLFFEVFMPWGRCLCRDEQILRCRAPMNLMELIPHVSKDEASLEAAFSALTISRVGRNKSDPRLIKESTKFYGKALKNLQRSLVNPDRAQSEQILAACLLLGYYESFEDVSGKSIGWVSHAQGAARVLQLRGPAAHQDGYAHLLFCGSRMSILYAAMLRRKRSFLEEKVWLEVPWAKKQYRSGCDLLIDTCVKIPGLMEDFDNAKRLTLASDQRVALIKCLEACMNVQQALGIWELWRKPSAAPIIKVHELEGPLDNYPFPHEIIFANHLFLTANLIHWTAHLLLATTVTELHLQIAGLTYPRVDRTQAIAAAQEQARQAATNIAQTIPYALLPDMGDLGINHITFPMHLAMGYFAMVEAKPICEWLTNVANTMKHKGLHVGMPDYGTFQKGLDPTSWITHQMAHDSHSMTSDSTYSIPSAIEMKSDFSKSAPREPDFPSRFTPHHSSANSPRPTHDDGFNRIDRASSGEPTLDEFDPEYDADSDVEYSSPASHDYSGSSRQGSVMAVPRHLQQIQLANASKGEFTFVEEDPSTHYIVSRFSVRDSSASPQQ